MFLVQVGCKDGDGLLEGVIGGVLMIYVFGVDEVEVVCEIVVILK